MADRTLPAMTTGVTVQVGERKVQIPAAEIKVEATSQIAHIEGAPVIFLASKDPALLNGLDLKGKAVVAVEDELANLSGDQMRAIVRKGRKFDEALATSRAVLELTVLRAPRLFIQPPRLLFKEQAEAGRTPALTVHSEGLAVLAVAPGHAPAMISIDIPPPMDSKVVAKNVIGILRGSDPVLSKTAVLLTAHYDHIGTVETAGPLSMHAAGDSTDRIYNGANDDGSGTVSVIEIARALAKLQPRPRRSILFMTFFGEERGELGSKFYGMHPIFPIAQTVADLNLEQMGRTDSTVGPQLNNASVTGFDYSDVTGFLRGAGQRLGVKVYRDAEGSDAYFTRSDNDALAEKGVPAHTVCVAFDYPDYHGLGDEWPKVNYENMAKVDRMILLALANLANSSKAPEWSARNPRTEHFRAARAAVTPGTK